MRRFPPALRLFRIDSFALYVAWAAVCTLASSLAFYRAMLQQTGGEWSAPLDDVFIHFDYAREAARGHPFHWTAGNGYSSGNTSVLYPFVLALGYLVGFKGESLMVWAGIVAAVSVFGTLLAAHRLVVHGEPNQRNQTGKALAFLVPPAFLAIGALDWSLWSGMEVSFFLATWALAFVAMHRVERAPRSEVFGAAGWLGGAGAILVLTRPEGAVTLLAFGVLAAMATLERHGLKVAAWVLMIAGLPATIALALQSAANLAFTGELSANGAIVKLAINHPFMTGTEKLDDYIQNLRYSVFRNVEYHFTDASIYGFLIPTLAGLSLASRETRRYGALLWAQIIGWLALVALNGQVRWQNERYTMPAVAWLLLAAVLGVYALVRRRPHLSIAVTAIVGAIAIQLVGIATRPGGTLPEVRFGWGLPLLGGVGAALAFRLWQFRAVFVTAALALAWFHQVDKVRDQKWFFARASRNIRDQHIVAGRWLAELRPKRVLVGDAGALIYASGAKGLDIIGLGGFHELPFARAGVQGIAATIELIERMAPGDRPDVMAIYPTWWGVLPTWFASDVLARFPVEGNVICGGYEDVIYRADWSVLGTGELLHTAPAGETVRDSVDIADLVSEHAHAYRFPHPSGGFTDMKILPGLGRDRGDVFDAGRRLSPGRAEGFRLGGLERGRPAHLVVRTAPEQPTTVRVIVGGVAIASVELTPTDGWMERAVLVPAEAVRANLDVEFRNEGPNDFIDHHVWVTQ